MWKKFLTKIKKYWIEVISALLLGLLIGGGIIYSIEEKQEQFWRGKYMEQSKSNDSLRTQMEILHKKNNILSKKNQALKDDLGITILSSIRSNFYDLKALKSENYNTQMYYNQEEYKSNLVPKRIGEKWDINVFDEKYKKELNHLMDTIIEKKSEEKK
jgi:hypothetical protein